VSKRMFAYYAAAVGRFTGFDPAEDQNNRLHKYAYGATNPVTHSDPSGTTFIEQMGCLAMQAVLLAIRVVSLGIVGGLFCGGASALDAWIEDEDRDPWEAFQSGFLTGFFLTALTVAFPVLAPLICAGVAASLAVAACDAWSRDKRALAVYRLVLMAIAVGGATRTSSIKRLCDFMVRAGAKTNPEITYLHPACRGDDWDRCRGRDALPL